MSNHTNDRSGVDQLKEIVERNKIIEHAALLADYAAANFMDITNCQQATGLENALSIQKTERELFIESMAQNPAKEIEEITYHAHVEPHILQKLASFRENGKSEEFMKFVEPIIRNEWKQPEKFERKLERTR